MPSVLLLAKTTGYQTRAFDAAAERLGVDLVYATDRCAVLPDPWRDGAVPVRFDDEAGSVAAILDLAARTPIEGVVAVGDQPTFVAACVCRRLGLAWHPPEAALAASNKLLTRRRLRGAGLATPRFLEAHIATDPHALATAIGYPVVVKPVAQSGSRGVIRANDPAELVAAFYRLRSLLQSPDLGRDPNRDVVLIEDFIDGREFAVEGLMCHGALSVLAVFDKPDPLDGPFFEESIYVTPSVAPLEVQNLMVCCLGEAARALGLRHGPIHAECRVNDRGVVVLEIAARPIGGLCSRALRFQRDTDGPSGPFYTLEDLVLRHALGDPCEGWRRETAASGVMMIPIPRRGVLRGVDGLDDARRVAGIEDVRITAKTDQVLVPLPEGASYLGFIFARADEPDAVEERLRRAHARLRFTIDAEVRVLQSGYA